MVSTGLLARTSISPTSTASKPDWYNCLAISGETIPGIVMLIMAAVLLPPVVEFVDKKWKFHFSGGLKIIIIIVGFIIFGATIETPTSEVQQIDQLKSETVQEEVKQENMVEPTNGIESNEQPAKD